MKKKIKRVIRTNIQSLLECRECTEGKEQREIDRAIGHLLNSIRKGKK